MSKCWKALISSMLCLSVLCSCTPSNDVVAKVGHQTITQRDLKEATQWYRAFQKALPEWQESTQDDAKKAERAWTMAVLEQLVLDALIEQDAAFSASKPSVESLLHEIDESLGGSEARKAQLDSFGISEPSFLEFVQRQAKAREHRKRFEEKTGADDRAMESYFKKHRSEFYRYDFREVTVPTRKEAQEIQKELSSDPKKFEEYQKKYESDDYSNTWAIEYPNVSKDDEKICDSQAFDQDPNEVEIYYKEDGYHVLDLVRRKEDYESARELVKPRYMEALYRNYINSLCNQENVRLFTKHLSVLDTKKEVESVEKSQ